MFISVFCAYYCSVPNNPTKKRAEVDLLPLCSPLTNKRLLSTFYEKRLADDVMADGGIVSSEDGRIRKSFAVT